MRLVVYSNNGQGLGIATHLSSEGHGVSIEFPMHPSAIGQGIVASTQKEVPDIVICDSNCFGSEADEARKNGKRVLGASKWASMLESNKDYSDSLIKAIGWDIKEIPNAANFNITTWFNGANYISTYISFVYKRFMPGGCGADIDFTGVIANFWQPTEKIRRVFLEPLSQILRRVNHRGCFHIRASANGNQVSVKDISASFSNPLALLLFENSKLTTSEILLKLFNEASTPIEPIEQWSAGVLLSIPPYPYAVPATPTSLLGIVPGNLKHLWLVDAKKEDDNWLTTGQHGKVGYVTARGSSIAEAARRIYRTIGNLKVKDLQYRNDVGKNIHDHLDTLRQNGWIK